MSPIAIKPENENSVQEIGIASKSSFFEENTQIFEDWKEWLYNSLSERAIKVYASQIRKLLEFVDKPIKYITYRDLLSYIKHCNQGQEKKWGRPLSRGTENGIKAALRKFWKYLTMPGIEIVENDVAKYLQTKKVLRMGVSQEKILNIQELKAILEKSQENPRDFALISTLYYAGLRKGEAQQLTWEDIDFDKRTIYIRRGKGDKPRDVTLNSNLARILQEFQEKTGDRHGYVFKSSKGNCMSSHTIDYTIHKYAARGGIRKNVHAHMFRHSHATHRIENDDDVKRVSMDLGHETVQITYDLYVHPTKTAREQGIDACLPNFI